MLTQGDGLRGSRAQAAARDEAIRTVQASRNTGLHLWADGLAGRDLRGVPGVVANDLQAHCALVAQHFPFATTRNSQARQQAAERAWPAIAGGYASTTAKTPGKQGYPPFQRDCFAGASRVLC